AKNGKRRKTSHSNHRDDFLARGPSYTYLQPLFLYGHPAVRVSLAFSRQHFHHSFAHSSSLDRSHFARRRRIPYFLRRVFCFEVPSRSDASLRLSGNCQPGNARNAFHLVRRGRTKIAPLGFRPRRFVRRIRLAHSTTVDLW